MSKFLENCIKVLMIVILIVIIFRACDAMPKSPRDTAFVIHYKIAYPQRVKIYCDTLHNQRDDINIYVIKQRNFDSDTYNLKTNDGTKIHSSTYPIEIIDYYSFSEKN